MTKYEYKIVPHPYASSEEQKKEGQAFDKIAFLENWLNKQGADGWQLMPFGISGGLLVESKIAYNPSDTTTTHLLLQRGTA